MVHPAQQRRPHLHLHCQMHPPQQQSPCHRPSGHKKAARCRCKAELLRKSVADNEIILSPISKARLAPFLPVSPASPTPIDSDSALVLSPPPDPTSLPPLSPMPVQSCRLNPQPACHFHVLHHRRHCPRRLTRSRRLSFQKRRCLACTSQPATPATLDRRFLYRPRPYPLSEML